MGVALKEGVSVKDTAARCNSRILTAFRRRHCFLKAKKWDVAERLVGTRARFGGIVDAVLPDQSTKSINIALDSKVSKDSILCIDGGSALWGFEYEGNLPCKVIPVIIYRYERNPIFHIQNVNGYQVRLKSRMSPFHCIATQIYSKPPWAAAYA
jgi:hypothetical protein